MYSPPTRNSASDTFPIGRLHALTRPKRQQIREHDGGWFRQLKEGEVHHQSDFALDLQIVEMLRIEGCRRNASQT